MAANKNFGDIVLGIILDKVFELHENDDRDSDEYVILMDVLKKAYERLE